MQLLAPTHHWRRIFKSPGKPIDVKFIGTLLTSLVLIVPSVVLAALPHAVDGELIPSLAPMLEKVTPAVVNIAASGQVKTRQRSLFNDPFFDRFFKRRQQQQTRKIQSVGSGVIVNASKGYIITNNHVIANTREIKVGLRDGRVLEAKLLGTDPATDVAVLQVDASGLTEVKVSDSDQLRVGDFVVAIGNPFGLGQTVTSGIVSALGRSGLGVGNYEDFIQTDASINEGNSGGALVNLRGELVGINSAIFARGGGSLGIGFAIPTNMVGSIMEQLVSNGKILRGQLGVASQDLNPKLAEAFGLDNTDGAVIVEVQDESMAAQAGLQAGDVVIQFNDRKIRRDADLRNAIGVLSVGEPIRLKIIRDGKTLEVVTEFGRKVETMLAAGQLNDRLTGAMFADINQESPLYGKVDGVLISEVETGSPAWSYGLRPGDLVVGANRIQTRNLKELKDAVARSGQALMLRIRRGSGSVFILIQ